MPCYRTIVQRLKVLETHEAFASGLAWYDRATQGVRKLAAATGFGPVTVARVIAVTSPQCSVARNIAIAHAVLTGGTARGLGANIRKAHAIIEDPRRSARYVGGPKVIAFANALIGNDDLVLDVHALRAVNFDQDRLRTSDRAAVVKAYRNRAKALGLRVCAYQAGIWQAQRHSAGLRGNGMGDLLDAVNAVIASGCE